LIEKRPFFWFKIGKKFSEIAKIFAQTAEFVQKIAVFCQDFSLHTFPACAIFFEKRQNRQKIALKFQFFTAKIFFDFNKF